MAVGDKAAAKGMQVIPSNGLVRDGEDEINRTRDYIADEIDARTAADNTLRARTPKITVASTAPASPAVGDLWIW